MCVCVCVYVSQCVCVGSCVSVCVVVCVHVCHGRRADARARPRRGRLARKPRVTQRLGRGGAAARVDGEQPPDEVLGVGRDVLPEARREADAAGERVQVDVVVRRAVEGLVPAEQDEDDDADGQDEQANAGGDYYSITTRLLLDYYSITT